MHKILVIRLYFLLMLYMFRTILVHLQEPIHVAIATQQPHVWYRHIPAYTKCDVQLIKVAPDDGLI